MTLNCVFGKGKYGITSAAPQSFRLVYNIIIVMSTLARRRRKFLDLVPGDFEIEGRITHGIRSKIRLRCIHFWRLKHLKPLLFP